MTQQITDSSVKDCCSIAPINSQLIIAKIRTRSSEFPIY